ncbi:unnamed protein product [Linum trigynum]|uniref:Pentatricopeptide repeat-containing protein n=1 Tax=Linum trigynum TaxID=586398 RepID=A0AAV2DYF0_9ROSI
MARIRSSSAKAPCVYLRKHRKWPHSPYKTQWHQTFNQVLAMKSLKEAAAGATSQRRREEDPSKTGLLSPLVNSFSIYNCHPTPQAYHFVFKTLAKTSQLHDIPRVLDHLETVEQFETPEFILADLIKIYCNAREMEKAVDLFSRIPKFRIKRVAHAIEVFHRMIDDGFIVEAEICSFLLSSLCEQTDISSADVIGFFGQLRKLGFVPGLIDYANLMRFLVKGGYGNDAVDVLDQMKSDGIKPDIVCYNLVLKGSVDSRDFALADKVFDELLLYGLVPDIRTYNVYIDGLCKQGKMEVGRKMVASMQELGCKPDVATFNTLLAALSKIGNMEGARELTREMGRNGIGKDMQTYEMLIKLFTSRGEVLEACGLVEELLHKRLDGFNDGVAGNLICRLCRSGLTDKAVELIVHMAERNVCPGFGAWEAVLFSWGSKLDFPETAFMGLVDSVQIE